MKCAVCAARLVLLSPHPFPRLIGLWSTGTFILFLVWDRCSSAGFIISINTSIVSDRWSPVVAAVYHFDLTGTPYDVAWFRYGAAGVPVVVRLLLFRCFDSIFGRLEVRICRGP